MGYRGLADVKCLRCFGYIQVSGDTMKDSQLMERHKSPQARGNGQLMLHQFLTRRHNQSQWLPFKKKYWTAPLILNKESASSRFIQAARTERSSENTSKGEGRSRRKERKLKERGRVLLPFIVIGLLTLNVRLATCSTGNSSSRRGSTQGCDHVR